MPSDVLRYGLKWAAGTDLLQIEFKFIRSGGRIVKDGKTYGDGLLAHYLAARKLCWPTRYSHRWTELMYREFIQNDLTVLLGAASCVAGETRLLNPITGQETRIDELCRRNIRPSVMTLAGPRLANVPFLKGRVELFEVTLDTGARFIASANHRALTARAFEPLCSFSVGQPLLAYVECRPNSNSDISQSVPLEGVYRWWKTTQDFQADCLSDFRSCDVQPLPYATVVQDAAPSLTDVRTRRACASPPVGDLERACEYTPEGLSVLRPSRHNDPFPVYSRETSSICCACEETAQPLSGWCERPEPLPIETIPDPPNTTGIHDFSHSLTCRQYRVQRAHIASIKSVGVQNYYDVEVPGVHHYFAEGAIHHNTQKTSHAVEFCLLNYWLRPESTLVILSTVNMDKLDIGCYAELMMLWKNAKARYPWLAGHSLPHKRAITTDNLEESGVRDFRKGVICRPCYVGGRWVGLGILAGTKQDYIFYVADELQFMQEAFSGSWPHLFSNGQAKIIGSGNPKHDPDDELSKTAEPKDGWASHPEPQKTEVWDTKFMGGRCINLVGTDSPNFDVPAGQPEPYKRLIGRNFARRIETDYGSDSFEYYRLVKGVMKVAFAHSRVITRQLCRSHGATDAAQWIDNTRQRIYFLDPSYGGDDSCVGGCLEWGKGMNDLTLIRVLGYRRYRFNLTIPKEVEDQIADILAEDLAAYGVDSSDVFYDATGKGTLGGAFARKFGSRAPVAIAAGGKPSKRPVRQDLWVDEPDGTRRLKRCDEEYYDFITELWFSVRYCIEANQMRELPEEFITEGCARIYERVAGNKLAVESKSDPKKKEDLKRRLGHSPDCFDALCIGMEGARQRGFQIAKLGESIESNENEDDFFEKESREYRETIQSKLLTHR